MRTIRVEDAENRVCCHDITEIVPGERKGRAFQKGHIITKEDIPKLRRMGKEHLYIWEDQIGLIHENEAAVRLAKAVCGHGLSFEEPGEGKISLTAAHDGICQINEALLLQVNMVDDVIVSTRNNLRPVCEGDVIAGLRAIPLAVDEAVLKRVEEICKGHEVIAVKHRRAIKTVVITTGNEVYHGLIQDAFGPFLRKKLSDYGCDFMEQVFVPDDAVIIAKAIRETLDAKAEMILVTGGMSVDPDDVTPRGIKESGAYVISYGMPILPGAMTMVAYLGEVPVLGLPGGVMYSRISALDLLLPYVITDEIITRQKIAALGLGGLCLQCPDCRYPNCSFGTRA